MARWRRHAAVAVPVVVAASVVASVPMIVSALLALRWTRDPSDLPLAEVALVPGAYIMADGSPGPHLRARLELATDLWRAGRVRAIIASGGHPAGGRCEPESMARWLIARGVPPDRIVLDEHGNSTYESVRRAQIVFGVRTMIICSQSYTLPRAVLTARALGVDAWGVADYTALREHPRSSRRGLVREIPATVKMIFDLLRRPAVAESGDRSAIARALR